MPDQPGHLGFALVCNYDGLITQVLWDDFALGDNLVGLSHFVCLFDPASVQKGLALFLYVKEHGVAFGWEINLLHEDSLHPFSFTAALINGQIVLMASAAELANNQIYDGLTHVINEQVNSLRTLSKRAAVVEDPVQHPGSEPPDPFIGEMLKDMLQLNNRLVNAERELARKNAELRRMSAVLSKDLYLAHRVLQCSGEAVVIANRERRVIDVNQAYTAITGFSKHESIGADLVLCESSHHESGFIDTIWQSVGNRGMWQGECTYRRKTGELFPKWLSISAVPDEAGNSSSHYVVTFSDISRLKSAEEKWQRLAFYDSLTNLPNRVLFKDRLQQAIVKARRDGDPLMLLFVDLDQFKVVNDSLGHEAGDRLLCEAARRIESCVRETDSICRLGGDEFTVIVSGCLTEIDILQVSEKIIQAFHAPFRIADETVHVGASIGIARFPFDGEDADTLTKHADAAMYAAKSAGRNTSRFFSRSLGEQMSRQLSVKTQIAQALQRGEFLLHLQPEIELATGKVVSLEALVRWQHPNQGLVAPDDFIPIAEETGLIIELGEFVMGEAIRIIRDLRAAGWSDLRIAVNVSRRQLAQPNLCDLILARLHECGVPGSALIVEITESMVMGNLDHAVRVLSNLRGCGIDAAIDDFGTDYSSLNFLRRLPVEFLKIDKSFVADADLAGESETIIRAIAAMAHSLGLKTVAEGVERPEQEALLSRIGCDLVQGYRYSRPLPYDRLLEFMNSAAGRANDAR